MAGNNRGFIKAFWAMSKSVVEGKPVTAGNPSPNGQTRTGTTSRPSLAQAMYPNLPN
jgi:hypothetical protein